MRNLKKIPDKPGVYLFKNKTGRILYVGKARNLRQRIKSYFLPSLLLGPKTQRMVEQIKDTEQTVVESEFEALLLEAALIKKYQPKYNWRLKDDKSFLYLKITKEEFPRLYAARKIEGGFGPFPKAQIVRQILRWLRLIFPYRSCPKLPKKACLYFDLKLCPGPCLGKIAKRTYQQTMAAINSLLSGQSRKLIKEQTREMAKKAKENEFEKAAQIRDQITKINWLIQSRPPVTFYLENPNLLEDLRTQELEDLGQRLRLYLTDLKSHPGRLEAYDISNLSGKQATGAMVVFLEGEAEKSLYRKFKIKIQGKPNDVAMIKEVLRRRLTHPEWEGPDLILVDGGKGQVSGVQEVLKELGLKIPVVGLAKKEEKLIIPSSGRFTEVVFPGDSPGLNLLRRLRDEAHRFALAYHRSLLLK